MYMTLCCIPLAGEALCEVSRGRGAPQGAGVPEELPQVPVRCFLPDSADGTGVDGRYGRSRDDAEVKATCPLLAQV